MAWLCVVCVHIFQGHEFVFRESSGGNWRWPAAEGSGPGGHRVSHQSAGLATQPATGVKWVWAALQVGRGLGCKERPP